MTYVMESRSETQRLVAQEKADRAIDYIALTGLKRGDRALDLGCGPGLIAKQMAQWVGSGGEVVGVDRSPDRIRAANELTFGQSNLRFVRGDAMNLNLADNSFDYCWSQFLFQYLPDKEGALSEMVRVARPGGTVVVSEFDGMGFSNWPFPPELENSLHKLVEQMSRTGFDLNVGRKMYAYFRSVGLSKIRVHLFPLYVLAGDGGEAVLNDWRIRFEALKTFGVDALGDEDRYQAFVEGYLELLRDPNALKYAVLLLTQGIKNG